ncbi:glycosyl hydrolase family 18 protein [Dyella nitratireducens]|nr:glycosyl hydrolase family 18 protein [Dyella nitratireducens]
MSRSNCSMAFTRRVRFMSFASLLLAAPSYAVNFPSHYAAPYLQIDSSDTGDMKADMHATGDKFYTLAFLTASSGCQLQWEAGSDSPNTFVSAVKTLQSAGGNVILSFGGEGSTELAQSCTSVSKLTTAYNHVISAYGVTRLDFDIEGDAVDDTAANTRRNKALAALQAKNSSLKIDYTLPVNPDGLPGDELDILKNAIDNGVKVNLVNIMTMDFGDGQNPLKDAESAAKATAAQLASLYGISTSAAYAKLGLTPIAGQNDDNEFFSLSDAQSLENFAASHGVQELAFWEVDGYDKGDGYAYSSVFNQITQ